MNDLSFSRRQALGALSASVAAVTLPGSARAFSQGAVPCGEAEVVSLLDAIGENLLAEGSWSKGSEIQDGYPEFTMAMLQKLGWDKDLTPEELATIQKVGGDAQACWEHLEMDGGQDVLGFGTVADGQWFAAKLKNPAVMAGLAPDQSEAWRGLGVSILHKLVLEKQLAALGGTPALTFVHLLKEVTDAVAAKTCQLAVLVPPATMDHVEEIAGNLEKMPPKSTYFYPKLLSGLVFNSLKVN